MCFNGNAYAVPLGMQMLNGVWYNVKIFKKYKPQEPKTWQEFQNVCSTLRANGLDPATGRADTAKTFFNSLDHFFLCYASGFPR